MQNIISDIYEKFQIENKIKTVKELSRNPVSHWIFVGIISIVLINWLQLKPLGLIFLLLLCLSIYKNCCTLRLQIPPELKKQLELVQQKTLIFRQTNPAMFCVVASGCLGILALVGHLVSGYVVLSTILTLAVAISTKYDFKIIKVESEDITGPETLHQDSEFDDEFMPEVDENNLFVLERAGDLASISVPSEEVENDDDKSDEIPSELLIPDSIPEIDENSTDDDQDDLLPIVPASKSESHIKDSNPDAIEFKKSHFKHDSSLSTTSSSSEESLSKGLQFPDYTAVDGTSKCNRLPSPTTVDEPITSIEKEANDLVSMTVKTQTQGFLANTSSLIPSLVTSLVQGVWGIGSSAPATHSGPIHDPTQRDLVTDPECEEGDFIFIEKEDLL